MTDAASDAGRAPRDPGLQGERTALSWSRTALSIAVNALLALRTGWVSGEPLLLALGVLLLVVAAATVGYGTYRGRHLTGHSDRHEPPAAPSAAVLLVTCAAILACVTGVLAVLARR